jgi:GT2 family glycosyltransferase
MVVALNRCTDRTRQIAESLGARCTVEDRKCIAAVRNAAVRASRASAVATLDADSWMSPGTVAAVLRRVYDPRCVGGGSLVLPERWSPGIVFSALAVAPYLIGRLVSAGMFWFRREAFEDIGGFDEGMVSIEDLDFGLRLRALGRRRGQRYGTVWRHGIRTSCRKFDAFGDWHLFRNPALVRRIFTGRDRGVADHYYYDITR